LSKFLLQTQMVSWLDFELSMSSQSYSCFCYESLGIYNDLSTHIYMQNDIMIYGILWSHIIYIPYIYIHIYIICKTKSDGPIISHMKFSPLGVQVTCSPSQRDNLFPSRSLFGSMPIFADSFPWHLPFQMHHFKDLLVRSGNKVLCYGQVWRHISPHSGFHANRLREGTKDIILIVAWEGMPKLALLCIPKCWKIIDNQTPFPLFEILVSQTILPNVLSYYYFFH